MCRPPNKKPPREVAILTMDGRQQKRLEELVERSGLGPSAILRGAHREIPRGLTSDKIKKWLKTPGCRVRKDHYDWVLARWEALIEQGYNLIEMSEAMRVALQREYDRTFVSARTILRQERDVPKGLTTPVIEAWLAGKTQSVRPAHYDWVLARWRALPDG